MDQKLAVLAKVPLLSGLDQKQLTEVGQLCDEVDVPAGYVLMREDTPGSEFFVILDGSVEITAGGATLRTMGANEFLGEIALVDHGHRTATATAKTPTRLLVMGTREFKSLLSAHPEIQGEVMLALAKRIRTTGSSPEE